MSQSFDKEKEGLGNSKVPGFWVIKEYIYLAKLTLKKLRSIKISYSLGSDNAAVQHLAILIVFFHQTKKL